MKKIALFVLLLFFLVTAAAVLADDAEIEQTRMDLLDALNALRVKQGIGELKFDSHLITAAQHQAEYLAELGRLVSSGPVGETVRDRATDAGYGGDKSFTVLETNAQIWVDTDVDYLIEEVWRKNGASLQAIYNTSVRQAGIGIADAADKHRYVVLMTAGLDDGTDDYTLTRPTYDYRTPKPTTSATPTSQPFVTSTANPDGGVYHVVKEGETFSEIAYAYGLDWYTLAVRNNIRYSETTPMVIIEGQVLAIEPTFTLTPTPTATRTPIPPTRTPRPTFTAGPEGLSTVVPTAASLPAPNLNRLLNQVSSWRHPVGWLLVILSVPGIILATRKKK